jgi:dihydrofolate reductase
MMICLIAAMDEQRAIGLGNAIPWRIPGEQKRFRELTTGNAVIMGRRTYESIGRPLAGRTSIVLTRGDLELTHDALLARSVEDAIEQARPFCKNAIFVGGGAVVYRTFMPLADVIYLTQVHGTFGGDTFFPEIDGSFRLTEACRVEGDRPYTYQTFERSVPT